MLPRFPCKLDPFLDKSRFRVGGWIHREDLEDQEKHPLILPAGHDVTTLLVQYYYDKVVHQGHHFTEDRLQAAGV